MSLGLLPPTPELRSPFAIAAERLTPDSRLAELDREREAALADIHAFARHTHFQDAEGADVRFSVVGWAWQWMLLLLFATTKLPVVLKARQLGVSWLLALYALWAAIRRPGQTVLLVSRGQDDADKLLEHVAYIWERLPAWKPRARVGVRKIVFPGLGSEIESMPATKNAGRSRTANLVILDELPHMPFARQILASAVGAAEKGQLIAVGTGNGMGTVHAGIYLTAKSENALAEATTNDGTRLDIQVTKDIGPNGWRGVFIPFRAHPDRDAEWRVAKRAELGELSDAEFAQEYPADDVEAIQASGRTVFRPQDLMRQTIEEPAEGQAPGVYLYREPEADHSYVIGADVAEGLEDSDWDSAAVIDRETGEQVAQLRGRWPPGVFAGKLDRLARYYAQHGRRGDPSTVVLAVERNNHGHACILRLVELHADSAPYTLYRARDKRNGWLTTPGTRPLLVDQLEEALRLEDIEIHDAETRTQFAIFRWNDNGKAEAPEGHHDDDVLAFGIAVQVRRRSRGRVLTTGRRAKEAA